MLTEEQYYNLSEALDKLASIYFDTHVGESYSRDGFHKMHKGFLATRKALHAIEIIPKFSDEIGIRCIEAILTSELTPFVKLKTIKKLLKDE